MSGGGGTDVPEPTAEERALQAQQAELLKTQRELLLEQSRLQQTLLPVFAESAGLKLLFDEEGNITGAEQAPEDPQQTLRDELETELLQQQLAEVERQRTEFEDSADLRNLQARIEEKLARRSLRALRGNLPVDPVLERELTNQEKELRERLSTQLGPGFETSTPGIEALSRFDESAAALRSSAQHGQLTLAEQLGLARANQGLNEATAGRGGLAGPLSLAELGLGQQSQNFGQVFSSAFQIPASIAGGLGSVAAGFGQAQQPFIAQRQLETQASIADANRQAGLFGGIGQLFGTIFGPKILDVMG